MANKVPSLRSCPIRASTPPQTALESRRRRAGRACRAQWRGPARQGRAAGGRDRQAHRPSAKDKFIVRDAETESTIWWGKNNVPMSPEHFAALKADFLAALAEKDDALRRRTSSAARSPSTGSASA